VPRPCVAETGSVELAREPGLAGVVDLVGRHDHRHVAAAQLARELGVPRAQPGAGVHDQHRDVGFVQRDQRLAADLLRHLVLAREVHAAGVDEREADPVPVRLDLLAVARHARLLVHDGLARIGQPVHERRLADVRVADDGDGRSFHLACSTSFAIRPTTSSTLRPVVSSSTAPGASMSGECSRSMSWASRSA
jgi:hypothetical protein